MNLFCRFGVLIALVLVTGCDSSASPLNWPSFDDNVIEAGRRPLLNQQHRQHQAIAPTSAKPVDKLIEKEATLPATRDAILQNLKIWIDERGEKGRSAIKQIEKLGIHAIDPLLEILGDESIPIRYAERTIYLLIPLGYHADGESRTTIVSSSASKIFDAVTNYLLLHPEANQYIGELSKIAQYDKIPKIIKLIESTSSRRQSAYIGVFNEITSNNFAVIPYGFCGNSSRDSIEKAVKEGEIRQRESVIAIKAWWTSHNNDLPKNHLISSLRERLHNQAASHDILRKSNRAWQQNSTILNLQLRSYPTKNLGPYASSAYEFLLLEFKRTSAEMKPYVLALLAMTHHPSAGEFVSDQLDDEDPNVQHAAIHALITLKAADYNDHIGRILHTTKDEGVAIKAIAALKDLAGANAIPDFVSALNRPEKPVRDRAKQALYGFLVSHANQIKELAKSNNKSVRLTLSDMLVQAKLATASDHDKSQIQGTKKQLAEVQLMLQSDNTERQKQGVFLVERRQLAQLIPDVLELIQSTDFNIRSAAVNLIKKMGIPKLTVENAPQLMGFSNSLDRHIAAYCYEKYGRAAIPVLRKAAFRLSDPLHRSTAPSSPAHGLIEALVKLKVKGIEADVIQFVKDSQFSARHISLLELLDDAKSAALVGELLKHGEQQIRGEAINAVRARTLSQFADQLFHLASLTVDKSKQKQLQIQHKNGRITDQQYNTQNRAIYNIPKEQYAATLALIDLGDSRAWQAVLTCLSGERLIWQKQGPLNGSPRILTQFGSSVSKLKASHRDEIQTKLLQELAEDNRERIIVSLTTALCLNPEEADSQVLWRIASTPHAHESARILSAVALSKLGDRRAVPVLQEIIRKLLSPDADQNSFGTWLPGFSYVQTESQQNFPTAYRSTSLHSISWPYLFRPSLDWHHIDLGLALRRLDDTSMTNELVNSLINKRGELNMLAYRFLAGIIGRKAYDYALQRLESNGHASPQISNHIAAALLDLEVPVEEVLPLIIEGDGQLPFIANLLMAQDTTKTAPLLEKAYLDPTNTNNHYKLMILESLCRNGNKNGLSLAVNNPLHFASLVRYIPEASGVDFPTGAFDYNRVEEAINAQTWYKQHKSDLHWNPDTSQFLLASHSP